MVEEQRVGGTCLHRGCIPAKELLQTAEVLRTVRSAADFGVLTSDPALQLATSQTREQTVVDRLTSGLESQLKGRKVTVVPGTGVLAPDGSLRLVGRRGTDLIKSGGFRIGAGEIESALLEHPAVAEAAVLGVSDADLGERIVAWVVCRGGATVTEQELVDQEWRRP